jgi:Cu/Ag efflux pump CusA
VGQPAGAGSGNADDADQRVRAEGRQGARHCGHGDVEKAAAPALAIHLNNDAAADLGINVQQVGATVRPLLAGDTVSYWLAPDGNNYEVNIQLPKDSRRLSADLSNLYMSTGKKGPDGETRMVPLRQVAEIVETTSPQIIKRQELQRRVALYANAEGTAVGRRQLGRAEDP